MASFTLGLAGNYFFGPIGGFIGAAIGSVIDQALFGPGDSVIEGQRLDDLRVSSSTYGAPIQRIFGTQRVKGNIDWSPGLVEHREEEDVGGGKGGPTTTIVTFTYTASFGITWGEGPAASILRMWLNKKLFGDRTDTTPVIGQAFLMAFFGVDEKPGSFSVREYLGTETQLPDPAEQADKGVADTSAYRGRIRTVFQDLPLADFGNRIPSAEAEIAMSATDAMPVIIISPSPGIPTSQFHLTATGTEAYVLQGAFEANQAHRLSLTNTEVLDTITYAGSDNLYIVDDFDRVWGSTGFGGGTTPIQLHDAQTGRLIATTDIDPAMGGIISQIVLLDGGRLGAIMVGANDKLCLIGPPLYDPITGLTGLILNMKQDSTSGYQLSDFFPGGYPILGADGITTDTLTGDIWISYSISGQGHLFRLGGPGLLAYEPAEEIIFPGHQLELMTYYEDRNSLIILANEGGSNESIIRYNLDTRTIDSELKTPIHGGLQNKAAWKVHNGLMYLQGTLTGAGRIYDVSGDEIVQIDTFVPTDWTGGVSNWEHPAYDPVNHAILVMGTSGADFGKYAWLFLDRKTGDDVTVRSIVEDVSARVGLVAGTDIDATALTDTLPGYLIDRRMAARRAIEPLARDFFFRSVETDFKVVFVKRGGAASFTIVEDDLGARSDPTAKAVDLLETRQQEVELPLSVDLTYQDPATDYQAAIQIAQRIAEAVTTQRRRSLAFPGSLGTAQAAQIVEKHLYLDWINRNQFGFTVDWSFILLNPGDVGTVAKGTATFTVELGETSYGADRVIQMKAVSDDTVIHTSAAEGADALGVPTQSIILAGPSALYMMDTPLLRDQDEGLIVYVASGAFGAQIWPGAGILKSTDGIDFPISFTGIVASRNVGHGFTLGILADHKSTKWDNINSITIRKFRGTFASDTDINVLNGANAVLIGDEIVQYVTRVLHADVSITLSRLLRGRKGTDWATRSHAVGDRVVILSASTVLREAMPDSDLDALRFYKAVTIGGSVSGGTQKILTYLGRSLKPYAPSDIRGTLDGSPGDWTITFKRRTRTFQAWRDKIDVAVNEAVESYEMDILDTSGSPTDTVVRTLTATTTTFNYSDAQQQTDFGSVQTELTVKIYQMNNVVGRGFAGRAVIRNGDTQSWIAEDT